MHAHCSRPESRPDTNSTSAIPPVLQDSRVNISAPTLASIRDFLPSLFSSAPSTSPIHNQYGFPFSSSLFLPLPKVYILGLKAVAPSKILAPPPPPPRDSAAAVLLKGRTERRRARDLQSQGAGPQSALKRQFSSPAPGLRGPTRHLSPALPAHTPLTPAAPRALPPPHAPAAASPCNAAPAS